MSDYTINAGDNLWNIAKTQYGNNLSNADIQKAVDTIVEANGIDDPNKINAGGKLDLPDAASIFEDANSKDSAQNEKSQPAQDKESVFVEFDMWQRKHEINMKKFAQGDYDEEGYNILEDKIGTSFDFMEGKDANDEEAYDEQTLKLGKGEVKQKDSDGDEKVTFEEYFSQELSWQGGLDNVKEYVKSGIFSEDEAVAMLTQTYLEAQAVFNVIDEAMGNDDGSLDETEFQTYYKYADTFESAKDKDKGSIHIDDVTGYPEYLAQQFDFSDIDTTPIEKMMRDLLAD